MALSIKNGLNAPEGFLSDVFALDKQTYSPELCGTLNNLEKRYNKCADSFLLVYDDEKLIGYMNFFPIIEDMRREITDRNNLCMRDDDISPEEIPDWQKDFENNIFILSVVISKEYRGGDAIKLLSNSFLEFLRNKNNDGYKIASLSGFAVSLSGVKFLKRLHASLVKSTKEGYHLFFANNEAIDDLLEDGMFLNTYQKTYKDDLYFFIPMAANDNSDDYFNALVKANKRKTLDKEDFDYTPLEDLSNHQFGDLYCKLLNRHVEYECNSNSFKGESIKRIYLGEVELACYDDDYDDIPLATEKAHLFVTAHRSTGLYIVTLAIPNNVYNPSQLIDQMSTDHLEIRTDENKCFLGIADFINSNFLAENANLHICGESKCVICMSQKPENEIELPYLLSGETMISKHIDYKIRPEHMQKLIRPRAIYDYYDSYISRSVIAFIFKNYSENIEKRLSDEASELFIVEIVLFQNTAVLRTNRRVVEELADSSNITNEDIDALYIEFGKTMQFWNSDIFKYPFSQIEANEVIESFGISATLAVYHRNQKFLDRLIEIKSNIAAEKSDKIMNRSLFFLSWIDGSSITLGAVLWIWHYFKENPSLKFASDVFLRFGWVVFCILIAVGVYRYASFKSSSKSTLKPKFKKKRTHYLKIKNDKSKK